MQFEIIYQELVQSAETIRTLIMGITQDEARTKPDPESWSILEVLCHLYDTEREDFRQHLDSILHRPTEAGNLLIRPVGSRREPTTNAI